MAFGASTFLVTESYADQPGREWQMAEVDCTVSGGTIVTTAPRAIVPIYDNEGITVLGMNTVTAGTATATIDLGIYTAAEAEVDLDWFLDVVDVATGVFTVAPGGTAPGSSTDVTGGNPTHVNVSGLTQYLCLTTATADDSAGKYRIYYKKFPVLEA